MIRQLPEFCTPKALLFVSLVVGVLSAQAQSTGYYRTFRSNSGWTNTVSSPGGTGGSTFQVYDAATQIWSDNTTQPGATTTVLIRDGFMQTTNTNNWNAGNLTVGEGQAAKLTATITDGVVTAITITDGGTLSGFVNPLAIIGSSTTAAQATASLKITGTYTSNPGSGYTTATVIVGTPWTASATVSAGNQLISNGNIYTVTTGGTTGTTAPSGTDASISDGTAVLSYAGPAATATATITDGAITAITINSQGSGYTLFPRVTISGDGTGASYGAYGTIESVTITNGGAGYSESPQVVAGSVFMAGNASTNRTGTVNGNLAFISGAKVIQGSATTTARTPTLNIGGDLTAESPISFRSVFGATTSNTNVIFTANGVPSTISGAAMTFNNLTVNSGETLTVSNDITILGTLTNNGTVVNNGTIRIDGTVAGTGTFSGNTVLSVKLVSFSTKADASTVKIDWATSFEENSDRFVIERSADGVSFAKIAEVKSRGPSSYSVVDRDPVNGVNYYRLVQYDKNGASEIFGPKAVNYTLNSSAASLSVYPNPTSGAITFSTAGLYGSAEAILTNIQGQVVHREKFSIAPGSYTLNIKSSLIQGQYFLTIVNNGTKKTSKVIIL